MSEPTFTPGPASDPSAPAAAAPEQPSLFGLGPASPGGTDWTAHIPAHGTPLALSEPPAEPAAAAPAAPAAPAEPSVEQRLAVAEARAEESRRLLDRLLEQNPQSQQVQHAPQAPPELPMPNPTEDPAGFQRWLDYTIAIRAEASSGQVREEVTAASLWRDIQSNPETAALAKHEWMFRQAFLDLGGQLGSDPQATARKVVELVKQRVAEISGGQPAAAGGYQLAPPSPMQPNRVSGLSGPSVPAPTARPAAPQGPTTLTGQLKQMQRRWGTY